MRFTASVFGFALLVTGGSLAAPVQAEVVPPPAAFEEQPLRPTDRRDLFSPALDIVILVALAIWLLMLQSRRRREESLFRASVYERFPVSRLPLRAVTYPSETDAEKLKQFRSQWIDEFRSLQVAWARHDLRPVSGILGPQVRGELERADAEQGVRFVASPNAAGPELTIRQADPADAWREDGKEFVTVHFAGSLREPGLSVSEEFDEFWTFARELEEAVESPGYRTKPWVVTAIRRGSRERSLPRLAHRP